VVLLLTSLGEFSSIHLRGGNNQMPHVSEQGKESAILGDIKLVTVADDRNWVKAHCKVCVGSWSKIIGLAEGMVIVDDGLGDDIRMEALDHGFSVHQMNDEMVVASLQKWPSLKEIRALLPTWRHVVDALILHREYSHVLLVDTDVLVTQTIAFLDQGYHFVANCDDVPGYRGKWVLPLKNPIIPAMNPGFFLMQPALVDIEWLDWLVGKYILGARKYWWTRQLALSALVARSSKSGMFSGYDVRVISGNYKRSRREIEENEYKMWGSSRQVENEGYIRDLIENAAVLHLAGRGKRWIGVAQEMCRKGAPPRLLAAIPARTATVLERVVIAARIAAVSRY
jgi:hypothetical protein